MSHIPNLITSVRLVAALALLLQTFFSNDRGQQHFLLLFCAAGLSDMLDGFVARRFGWCTEYGAHLDSLSDLILYLSVLVFLVVNASNEIATATFALVIGAAFQICHIVYGVLKHKTYPSYHTTFSRVCAYLMFFGVIAFWIMRTELVLLGLTSIWILCSLEGITITGILPLPLSNLRGIGSAIATTRKIQHRV